MSAWIGQHPELFVGGTMLVGLVIFLIGALNDRP